MIDPLTALLIAAGLTGVIITIFLPEQGLYPRWREGRRMTKRVQSEDALKFIHKREMERRGSTVESVAGVLHKRMDKTAVLLTIMQKDGLLTIENNQLHLTNKGRESALHIIRAHRLWERYLADKTGYTEADWHGRAELREHEMSTAELDALAAKLGNPTHDPHGDPIPRADGEVMIIAGRPLPATTCDTPARIIHLEDEPPIVYAQLIAEGLHPGMNIRMVESTNERVRFWSNGAEHLLAPIVANNITVQPIPNLDDIKPDETNYRLLSNLEIGESGVVAGIAPSCRGAERRRFMDLGILRGTTITAEMSSPGGDPTAYEIRGALIALRENQAKQIRIQSPEQATQQRATRWIAHSQGI